MEETSPYPDVHSHVKSLPANSMVVIFAVRKEKGVCFCSAEGSLESDFINHQAQATDEVLSLCQGLFTRVIEIYKDPDEYANGGKHVELQQTLRDGRLN